MDDHLLEHLAVGPVNRSYYVTNGWAVTSQSPCEAVFPVPDITWPKRQKRRRWLDTGSEISLMWDWRTGYRCDCDRKNLEDPTSWAYQIRALRARQEREQIRNTTSAYRVVDETVGSVDPALSQHLPDSDRRLARELVTAGRLTRDPFITTAVKLGVNEVCVRQVLCIDAYAPHATSSELA